jgi:hypothetical protein
VEANNSCVGTLIFGSFSFIAFLPSFFPPLFIFFYLAFYCLFSFFNLVFLSPLVSSIFCSYFVLVFLAHVISSLAYPTCLRLKCLVVIVVVVVVPYVTAIMET